ncbi:chalcone isomerase family protein [soil metagenome]
MLFNLPYKKMSSFWSPSALAVILALAQSQLFASEWRQHLPQAKLIGSGDLRWFGLPVYSAKLWAEAANFDPKTNFALELTYQLSISRERFVDTSIDEIKRLQGDKVNAETLRRWKAYMEKAFTDVRSGDQLIGVNLPQIGCRFYSKDKLLAEVNDTEFSEAFFAIWFDPRSKESGLRKQLTGISR